MAVLRQFNFEISNAAKYRCYNGQIVARDEAQAIKRLNALNKDIEGLKLIETAKEPYNIDLNDGGVLYMDKTPRPTVRLPLKG